MMHQIISRRLFLAAAVVVFAVIAVSMIFADRGLVTDDEGLFNVIQEYSFSGHMAYPLHGQPGFFTIHPPVHYFVTAVLFAFGLPLFHAAAAPTLAFVALAMAVVTRGPFFMYERWATLAALAVIFLILFKISLIRPENCIAAAWFAGLLGLEAARRTRWAPIWCFVGAFATAYASVLHYWAGPAIGAVAIIFFTILVSHMPQGRKRAAEAALAAGSLVVYVPVIAFFVLPYHKEILEVIRGVGATDGGILASLDTYFAVGITRDALLAEWPPEFRIIAEVFAFPVYYLKVPLLIVALVILRLAGASILFLACASILPSFVIFFVSRKYTYLYMGPELLLYGFAICVGTSVFLTAAMRRLWLDESPFRFAMVKGAVAATPALLLIGTSIAASGILKSPMAAQPREWFIIRDSARRIVGPDAFIASNSINGWYQIGGSTMHQITRWGFVAADLDGKEYRCVDAYAILNNSFTNDLKAVPLPWFYIDHQLYLMGGIIYGSEAILYARRTPTARPRFIVIDPKEDLAFDLTYDRGGQLEIVTYVSKFGDSYLAGSPIKGGIALEFSSTSDNTWLSVAFRSRTKEALTVDTARRPIKIIERIPVSGVGKPLDTRGLPDGRDHVLVRHSLEDLEAESQRRCK
jgi:hypothetical protein